LVQVTVARAGSVKVFVEELKLSIATSVFIALTGADALVSEPLPCVLLKSATATNIANATVPVFKCFRSGKSTDTRLAVSFRWGRREPNMRSVLPELDVSDDVICKIAFSYSYHSD